MGTAERIVRDVLNESSLVLPRLRPGTPLEEQVTAALREAGLLEGGEREEEDRGTDADPADPQDRGTPGPEVHDGTLVR